MMDHLHAAFLGAVVEARLAEAAARRQARDAARQRRAARRARRDEAAAGPRRNLWPWRRATRGRPDTTAPTTLHAAPPPTDPVAVELGHLLEDLVQRAARYGTGPQRRALAEIAAATRSVAPGAAAALVERGGPEVARLRALGVLHGVVLDDLGPAQQARLLDRLQGGTADTRALVA